MTDILLDTSVVIDYLRNDQRAVSYVNALIPPILSIITVGEIFEGCRDRNELRLVEKTLAKFTIFPISEEISVKAITLVKQFHLSHGLRIIDSLIAATASTYNFTLITSNIKHFRAITEVHLIKWPIDDKAVRV
jgi:hypothetical protein